MKGSYPSITPTYSKQLRDLIISMLSPKPQNRPTIVDVINKPFIRKRVEKYMNDMFNRNSNNILDNDDIYLDTLREQATSLQIYPINPNSNPNSNPNPNAPIT
jgi:serine/threonine protein kinase